MHLDGFFLRLRLGKWEEGLGGTGYYVACITGIASVISLINNLNYDLHLRHISPVFPNKSVPS